MVVRATVAAVGWASITKDWTPSSAADFATVPPPSLEAGGDEAVDCAFEWQERKKAIEDKKRERIN